MLHSLTPEEAEQFCQSIRYTERHPRLTVEDRYESLERVRQAFHNIHKMTREEYRDELHRRLVSENPGWVTSEEIIERYLHITYDNINVSDELMRIFRCREVVSCLLSYMNESDVRMFIKSTIRRQSTHPLHVLALYGFGVPWENRSEILIRIANMYSSNSMEEEAVIARAASEQASGLG